MANKKKKAKPTKTRSQRYIEPIGSPCLRVDVISKWVDAYIDNSEREKLISSPEWKTYCNRAFMIFRLMQRDAAAIASNQLNFPFPAFVWKYNGKFEIVLCPKIIYPGGSMPPDIGVSKTALENYDRIRAHSEETVAGTEGCLSVPGKMVEVERYTSIVLEGYDHFGDPIEPRLVTGWEARIVQHEYDHLLGNVIVDYLPEEDKCDYLESIRKGGAASS